MSRSHEKQVAHAYLLNHAQHSGLTVAEAMNLEPDHWLSLLEDALKIKVSRDGDLASLKYNQQDSPMELAIVRQCRGMVVDLRARRVLAHPYDKFWNVGEPLADEIDWSTARAQEKLDGSLMILYLHDGVYQVASSGHPTAGGNFNGSTRTFREVFWDVFLDTNMRLPLSWLLNRTCFMFELVGPDNRIVVNYPTARLIVHGARDLQTGRELSRAELEGIATDHDWPIVAEHVIGSVEKTVAFANSRDPSSYEGFVVVDADHRRVKVKSEAYVRLHHLRSEFTVRRAIELWQAGETSEVAAYFPEIGGRIELVKAALVAACTCALAAYKRLGGLPRKEFAAEVKDQPWSAIAFRLLAHRSDELGPPTLEHALAIGRSLSASALERIIEAG